ncbi:MAG: hypothetical protein ACRDKB_00970 [Actinomycetota bacterium]
MQVALLVLLVIVVAVLVIRARGGFRRSWDDTDAWDALKRVGDKASKKNERGTTGPT